MNRQDLKSRLRSLLQKHEIKHGIELDQARIEEFLEEASSVFHYHTLKFGADILMCMEEPYENTPSEAA